MEEEQSSTEQDEKDDVGSMKQEEKHENMGSIEQAEKDESMESSEQEEKDGNIEFSEQQEKDENVESAEQENSEILESAEQEEKDNCVEEQNIKEILCERDMVFTVNPDPCHILEVTVVEGHHISKGYLSDLMDTPDPYVVLKVPGSPNGKKRTRHFDNTVSPIWKEAFTFVLDPEKHLELEVTLMDANYTIDQKLGSASIDLSVLVLDEMEEHILEMGVGAKLVLQLRLSLDYKSDLRYSLALCEKEKEFRKSRRKIVLSKMCELLGEQGPQEEKEVPTIGILGSGGGFRAMTASSGAFKALSESGILDCATYIAGLSGSAWFLSTLYSHPEFPSKSHVEFQNELKSSICHSPFWLLGPRSLYRYITNIKAKYGSGQPVSFTDFFGHLLGDTLLKKRNDSKLSDQQSKVDGGQAPLPLYTCLHVKSNVSAKVFQDWLEFSPYEVGISKYAAFMKTEDFGSKLYKGKIVKKYPEYPLHFLQGVWGSAFCILFKRLIHDRTKLSLDINPCREDSDTSDDENEIYYDAEEDFPVSEEDHLRTVLDNFDICDDEINHIHSDSDEELQRGASDESSAASEAESSGFWKEFVNNICTSSVLDTRKGRAGLILNPLRGLSLIPCFNFSPFSPTSPSDDMLFKGLTEAIPTQSKTLYLVDGGLTFNLPFPLLLRPQRGIDVYLAFDFSSRDADNIPPFKELLLSEKWAKINNCLFPPIRDLVTEYIKQPLKECYVFRHPTNEMCPIILYFPLVNLDFKKYKKPGVLRETEEEINFANFSIFSDPNQPYAIYNFKYPHQKFDRLAQLMEFNVLNNLDIIKETIIYAIERKKRLAPPASVVLTDLPQRKMSKH